MKYLKLPAVLFGLGALVGILVAFAYSRAPGVKQLKTLAAKLPGAQPPTA